MDEIYIFPSPISTQHPILTKWKHVFRNFSKCIDTFINNEIQKYCIYISINTTESILCNAEAPLAAIPDFSCLGYDCTSLHIWIWGFSPILPCRFSQTLKLDSNLQVFPQIFNGIQVWATQGLSHSCSEAVTLAAWLGSLSCWKVNICHSLRWFQAGSHQWFAWIWLHSLFPLSLPVSQALPLKSIPITWCCHHHASQ